MELFCRKAVPRVTQARALEEGKIFEGWDKGPLKDVLGLGIEPSGADKMSVPSGEANRLPQRSILHNFIAGRLNKNRKNTSII